MERYKKKIKRDMVIGEMLIAVALLFCGFSALVGNKTIVIEGINDHIVEFQAGVFAGIAALAVVYIIQKQKALKNPVKLQELYHKENDERQILIRQKAGMPMLAICSLVMIFAGIVAGYFNILIFQTLIAAAAAQMLIGAFTKLYYIKSL